MKICSYCGGALVPFLYTPIGSRRNSQVVQCESCGLCQTFQTADPERGKRTLSSDAGWGNVRHAKGVRLESQKANLKELLTTIPKNASVLDIGSSRGQFIEWCQTYFPRFTLVGIECDDRIANTFKSSNIQIILGKIENIEFEKNEKFDFIMCNHTLEHVDNLNRVIDVMLKLLKPEGLIWIDVPNLEGIKDPFVIEEFFIDKHTFHFELPTLLNVLTSKGLKVKANFSDNLNLVLVVVDGGEKKQTTIKPVINARDFTDYSFNLIQNRLKLPEVASTLESKSNIAFYGAGRILDALIRFGKLKIGNTQVADRYLWKSASDLGVDIQNPDLIDWTKFNEVFILGRSSVAAITLWLESKGAKKITPISAIWPKENQV